MSLNLATGVFTRWNDAGLDTSIDSLFWADTAPEGDVLPRAVYDIPSDDEVGLSRGSMVHIARLRFKTWEATPELVAGHNDSIQSDFHNGDKAATNPLTMSGGTVTHCLFKSKTTVEEDPEVYMGVIDFEIQYTEANTVPG